MLPHAKLLLGHLRRLAPPAAPDAALLGRWLSQRDEDAFAALVARHGPMVLGVCRRVLRDAQHAEDAFQAAFLVLARQADRLRRPDALASFLYGTALRLACKARGGVRRWGAPPWNSMPEPADPHPDPLDLLSGKYLERRPAIGELRDRRERRSGRTRLPRALAPPRCGGRVAHLHDAA